MVHSSGAAWCLPAERLWCTVANTHATVRVTSDPGGTGIIEPGRALGDLYADGISGEAVELVRLFVRRTNKNKSNLAFISVIAIL